jgi:hypothetical protein
VSPSGANATKNPHGCEHHDASAMLEDDVQPLAETWTARGGPVFDDGTFSHWGPVYVNDYVTDFKSLGLPGGRHSNGPPWMGLKSKAFRRISAAHRAAHPSASRTLDCCRRTAGEHPGRRPTGQLVTVPQTTARPEVTSHPPRAGLLLTAGPRTRPSLLLAAVRGR